MTTDVVHPGRDRGPSRTRVLVVEDSLTVRRLICDALDSDPELRVVGEAEDGKRAVELCRELRPDVVTLDMQLPVMSGLTATEYIMAHFPTPILIVSSSTNRGELFKTYDALAAGAVDVFEKPRGDEDGRDWERRLVTAVKMVARIKVITHVRGRLGGTGLTEPRPAVAADPPHSRRFSRIVALGASTGGPGALVQVLRTMPVGVRLPVLIVLHIDEPFGSAFADWLGDQISRRVAFARDGESISSMGDAVAMAPPGQHLVVRDGTLRLNSDPERHSCRPSIDVLFESLAAEDGRSVIAALLTGMGRDGAAGLLALRRAGAYTIAQDEASSVVYGMPREAALLGAAERIAPLSDIGSAIAEQVGAGARV